jgi:hypothetical protein
MSLATLGLETEVPTHNAVGNHDWLTASENPRM